MNAEPPIELFLKPSYRYAVVGATTNQEKYGYRVLRDLKRADFSVVGVNPKYTEIEDIPIYPSLTAVPDKPDVAVVVVPPSVGLTILDEAKTAGITKLWFQPGAESDDIIAKAKTLGLDVIADGSCIMVERQQLTQK